MQFAERLSQQFENHATLLPGADSPEIMARRQEALSRFAAHGLPDLKREQWKYTDLRALESTSYVALDDETSDVATELALSGIDDFSAHLIVFCNGRFVPAASRLDRLPAAVEVSMLSALLQKASPTITARLTNGDGAFGDLNTAFLRDGVYLTFAESARVDEPIHVVFVNQPTAQPRLHTNRLIVRGAENSCGTVIESHLSAAAVSCVSNAVTDIVAGPGATLRHYRLQHDTEEVHHIGNVFVGVDRDAKLETYSFAFGGGITRIDLNAELQGSGGELLMNGLFVAGRDQHIDHHTRVHHQVGYTNSQEHYRGIADGNGRGVFSGKIVVDKDAQVIDAEQSSRNLLLSDDAEIDTKPALEIYADDVKCAHGATVGQLDEDAYFYLRSRGIDRATARGILTYAFAADIAEQVTSAPLREYLEQLIKRRTDAVPLDELETRG